MYTHTHRTKTHLSLLKSSLYRLGDEHKTIDIYDTPMNCGINWNFDTMLEHVIAAS